jgi:hypothetical protein
LDCAVAAALVDLDLERRKACVRRYHRTTITAYRIKRNATPRGQKSFTGFNECNLVFERSEIIRAP